MESGDDGYRLENGNALSHEGCGSQRGRGVRVLPKTLKIILKESIRHLLLKASECDERLRRCRSRS
jgi:uncharacterized spore protein YtfJ